MRFKLFANLLHAFLRYYCDMKVMIRLLFTLYIAFLAVLPCSDKKLSIDENAGSFITASSYDHNDGEIHMCTPFCTCSCCSTHIRLISSFVVTITDPLHNTLLSTPYTERPSVNNSQSIWQPPKLS